MKISPKKISTLFNPILKKCSADLSEYIFTRYTNTLMDILLIADPCISKFTLKIEIINGKVVILHSPPSAAGLFKRRSDGIIVLLEKTLEHHPINDCILYIHVKDTYIRYDEPFFIYAKPMNKKGLLVIDHSWIDAEPEKKLTKEKGGDMVSIDDIRNKTYRNINPRNKKNSLFFIGQNVPLINSDFFFRKHFAKLPWPFEVKTTGYLNMGEYSKWKYLLNLPGWYPWSFRFKFLFLMNSFIININLLRPDLNEDKWINVMDSLFIPGKDYIEIDYIFNTAPENISILSDTIIETFKKYNYAKQDFDKIVENGKKKGDLLTCSNILELNAAIFNGYSIASSKQLIKHERRSPIKGLNKIIFEYQTKLQASSINLIYSKNSKVFLLSSDYILKYYPCSLEGYNELKTYEALNNNYPGFSMLYDCFIDSGILHFVLEAFDINLYQYSSAYKLNKQLWIKIKSGLITSISALHKLNIYHNNIIPENILYSYKKDKFYFIDFKLSSSCKGSIENDLSQIEMLEELCSDPKTNAILIAIPNAPAAQINRV